MVLPIVSGQYFRGDGLVKGALPVGRIHNPGRGTGRGRPPELPGVGPTGVFVGILQRSRGAFRRRGPGAASRDCGVEEDVR